MIEYIIEHIGEIASLLAVMGTILGAIFLSHKSLHKDIMEIKSDIRNANSRIDNLYTQVNSLYSIMMTFLMNGKSK
jgi:DNA-binding transcriptional regulator GbsR (MarR family)